MIAALGEWQQNLILGSRPRAWDCACLLTGGVFTPVLLVLQGVSEDSKGGGGHRGADSCGQTPAWPGRRAPRSGRGLARGSHGIVAPSRARCHETEGLGPARNTWARPASHKAAQPPRGLESQSTGFLPSGAVTEPGAFSPRAWCFLPLQPHNTAGIRWHQNGLGAPAVGSGSLSSLPSLPSPKQPRASGLPSHLPRPLTLSASFANRQQIYKKQYKEFPLSPPRGVSLMAQWLKTHLPI